MSSISFWAISIALGSLGDQLLCDWAQRLGFGLGRLDCFGSKKRSGKVRQHRLLV